MGHFSQVELPATCPEDIPGEMKCLLSTSISAAFPGGKWRATVGCCWPFWSAHMAGSAKATPPGTLTMESSLQHDLTIAGRCGLDRQLAPIRGPSIECSIEFVTSTD